MKKQTLVALILSTVCFSAHSAEKIATIDFSTVYNQLPELKSATDQLESEFKPTVAKLQSQESTLNKKIQEFQKKASKLSTKDLNTQKNKLEQEQAKLDADVKSFMKNKTERLEEVRNGFLDKIKEVAKNVSKSKGYDMVVDASAVVWVDNKDDLTQDVIKNIK